MADQYTVIRSFEKHSRLYRSGETHDLSEWPGDTRSIDIAGAIHDGLISVKEEPSASPGKTDPALSSPSGTKTKR